MGCSNARLLVQAPSATETGARTNKPLPSPTEGTTPANVAIDTTTRMHLTGVDLVVERNGSYTLLLTPKTHKQLMPYVLRKKRFRILVDKPRPEQAIVASEATIENNPDLKSTCEKDKLSKDNKMEQIAVASLEKVASEELNKTKHKLLRGRSIDRGSPGDDEENIQSDEEGLIEEIVTTVEQDKDLECKVKKKIQTKKTMSHDPDTRSTITKVVKTEVTEITRTITINDHHDLERAKRELGIDDVNKLLPSSSWRNQSTSVETKEKCPETVEEPVVSKELVLDYQKKMPEMDKKRILAGSTSVGRGPVSETVASPISKLEQAPNEKVKKKKKKSKLCSCTRSTDEEHEKKIPPITLTEEKQTTSTVATPATKFAIDTQIQGQRLISDDIKQLIVDKKFLLIAYMHSKIFAPLNLFASDEQDMKGRKVSSRILDLLRYDRCSSWTQMLEQLNEEYNNYLPSNSMIQPMVNTYDTLLNQKQSNLLNTFATIHNENDTKNIQENNEYICVTQKYMHQQDSQPVIEAAAQQTMDSKEETPDNSQTNIPEEQADTVISDDEQSLKEVNMTDDLQQPSPVYNEEQLTKILAGVSQHRPITLAEAIAYQYLDIEDPKLGISTDTVQHIKHLFRPLSDQSVSNLIRVQRSGEYLTDINLAETNPFEKLNVTEPHIYQLQQSFEPTLDFNEKQFRSLTEAILSNKEQYDQLEFFIARSSLPICDIKESVTNDFSQSDSGYSMTTATQDSLASKIKIEFEPIANQDLAVPPIRDDIHEHEKIDLDKATPEKLNEYELDHELIQIIKSNFNGSDKTVGQAILSRELRLDSTDPNDVARLHSMGIYKEQARIFNAFFFPKQTRIIAYSPEPGRFVEAQTRYNPEFPGYKTDTTIIQIQEKQLSLEHLAKQRSVHDESTTPITSEVVQEIETSTPLASPLPVVLPESVPTTESKEKQISSVPPPPPAAPTKKRKSSGSGGLLSCFKSKKPKPGTEQQGQATIQSPPVSGVINLQQQAAGSNAEQSTQAKSVINYGIGPDGKRIYIDAFRDRPGLDMSYKPADFESRFSIPIEKPASEYEKPLLSEQESLPTKAIKVDHEPIIHLQPRSPVIEPVDVQPEPVPIIIPSTKTEHVTVAKKSTTSLHGAGVELPKLELLEPGPLPSISLKKEKQGTKLKKSSLGLCASCFSAKSKEKSKQQTSASEPVSAPVQTKKITEEVKPEDKTSLAIAESSTLSSSPETTVNENVLLPKVNIDVFRERSFQTSVKTSPKPDDRFNVASEKIAPVVESEKAAVSAEPLTSSVAINATVGATPVVLPKDNTSIFSRVNIDSFRERTFDKANQSKNLPKPDNLPETTIEKVVVASEEPHYQAPKNELIAPPVTTTAINELVSKDASVFSHVNIDTFRERTLEKGIKNLSKPETQLKTIQEKAASPIEEPHYEFPKNEPITSLIAKPAELISKDTSIFSQVNIDTFRERVFEKPSKSAFKVVENSEVKIEKPITNEEPHYQSPSSELVLPLQMPTENEYSTVERDTYDVPRSIELGTVKTATVDLKTEQKIINNETMLSSAAEIQKSSGDFVQSKTADEKLKAEGIHAASSNIKFTADVQQKSATKKHGLFSTLFHHKKQKTKIPALELPPVEHALLSNTAVPPVHKTDHEPIRIPSTNLPKLDIQLPTYIRPEVNVTAGQTKQTSEFTIPAVNLSPIPNVQFPESSQQVVESKCEPIKVPSVELPELQFMLNEQKDINVKDTKAKQEIQRITETAATIPPVEMKTQQQANTLEDASKIATDQDTSLLDTNFTVKVESVLPESPSNEVESKSKLETIKIEQEVTNVETNIGKSTEVSLSTKNETTSDLNSQVTSASPQLELSSTVPTLPLTSNDSSNSQKQKIEQIKTTKKSSTFTLCSCLGRKSAGSKDGARPIEAPKVNLPEVNMSVAPCNASATIKAPEKFLIPVANLPPVDLSPPSIQIVTLSSIHIKDKKEAPKKTEQIALTADTKKEETQIQAPTINSSLQKFTEENTTASSTASAVATGLKPEIQNKNVPFLQKLLPSSEFKVPASNIPDIDLSGPPKSDVYVPWSKKQETISIPEQMQSCSDSGIETVVASHIRPSSTFVTNATMDDIQQYPSISSGLGSEALDKTTLKSDTLPDMQELQSSAEKIVETSIEKYDFTRRITMNDEMRAKLQFREVQLKQCLESEISKSIDDFDPKKDHKALEKILTHAIDLIKDKKVATYPDLKQKLIFEHKHDAFIVDPVIRSLYFSIERHGLDNLDKPEFPLAIRDMVRLPAKQTYDTVTHLNKAEPLTTTQMTNDKVSSVSSVSVRNEIPATTDKTSLEESTRPTEHATRSCLTCGRSRSKPKLSPSSISSSAGLLDERRRTQINNHRNELGTILHQHIQSSQPPIRKFDEHSRDADKILRRSLVLVTQPKILSYEQLRHDLKTEYKQTFYLVDPTVDIVRDTINHCDITQMNEKINLDILDSNVSQTAYLYNTQVNLLTLEEYNTLKSNQLAWLQHYLVDNELKEKKITRKQNKELNKILHRSLEILSTSTITTWDELVLQLQREYPKAHDLCNRSIDLLKQSKKDGLLLLQQAPNEGKRRPSWLITERAKQNLKANRAKITSSLKSLLVTHNKLSNESSQLDNYINKTLTYLEEQKQGQFKSYNDLKQQLKEDFKQDNQDALIEQLVDIVEQAHATNQFDNIEKPEVQTFMRERLEGKPLVIKEMYVSLPPRIGALKGSSDDGSFHASTSINGDESLKNTTASHAVVRGLSWREANERARILFYRGKHPAIHYDEKADAFDVRMLLETTSGGTQEIPVTDSDVHELLNSCGVQWDGVNIISLVDHSEDVVRAAEQAALKVIREKGIIDIRAPPPAEHDDVYDDTNDESATSADATTSSS